MRSPCRNTVLGAVALAILLAFGGTAHAQSKCHAGKLKCVVKKKSCLLNLKAKELKTGVAIDPAKALKCRVKFGGTCDAGANAGNVCETNSECPGGTCAKGCFTKLEAKVPTPPDLPCPEPPGDAPAMEAKIDAFVLDVENELDLTPGANLQACQAGKIKCVINKDKCVLNVWGKAFQKGLPVDPAKLAKCFAKFGGTCSAGANVGNPCTVNSECPGGTCDGGCFTKLEAKPPCQTFGDAQALEAKVDAFDNDVLAELSGAPVGVVCQGGANNGNACILNSECPGGICPTCPTEIQFTGTSSNGVLDTGWTGLGHDATTITDGTVTVTVTACSGGINPPCDVCTYGGPVENHAGQLHVRRCMFDSAILCTSDSDCGGSAPCEFFFGSYLPLAAGGVSTCVQNVFNGGISGTTNVDSSGAGAGTSQGSASVTSRVYSGPTLGEPCPRCVGDGLANDGVKGGTCSAGLHSGGLCDASGSSPNPEWGTTSLDCPPLPGGAIASLAIDLSNTTGTKTRTLTAANPRCRAVGFNGPTDCGGGPCACQCDTCDNAGAEPCSTNADCPINFLSPGICGGKRCLGGANNGFPCAVNTECPGGGACGVPGLATAPNACDGGSGDCVPGDNTPLTSVNDRNCLTGPFEQFCGPVETFRFCATNADCTFPGDTCSIGRFRECFDNGIVGEIVQSSGGADPPSGHQSDPTLAAMFCIGPTVSSSVNSAAGLPGLGRLELQGHAADNGTP